MAGSVGAVVLAALSVAVLTSPAPDSPPGVQAQQWYLGAVEATQAQSVTRGEGVVVGVLHTGVDARHPDLAAAVEPGTSFAGPGGDARSDPQGIGTHLAGIIAAAGGGGAHALGIAAAARILPVAMPVPPSGAVLAASLRWAVAHGARVIVVAGRAGEPDAASAAAIAYARARDVVVVAGVGTLAEGIGTPGNLAGVVTVAATTRDGGHLPGTASGPGISLSAPGEDLLNACPRDLCSSGYLRADTTVGAAAIVAGVAALVRARYPKLTAEQVAGRLEATATDLGPAGTDDTFGARLVNAKAAVAGPADSSYQPAQILAWLDLPVHIAQVVAVLTAAVLVTGALILHYRQTTQVRRAPSLCAGGPPSGTRLPAGFDPLAVRGYPPQWPPGHPAQPPPPLLFPPAGIAHQTPTDGQNREWPPDA